MKGPGHDAASHLTPPRYRGAAIEQMPPIGTRSSHLILHPDFRLRERLANIASSQTTIEMAPPNARRSRTVLAAATVMSASAANARLTTNTRATISGTVKPL